MPFVQQDGRLTWVPDAARPARSPRQLIELAARQLADTATDEEYICIAVPAGGPDGAEARVCFRLEGSSWVFDKMG